MNPHSLLITWLGKHLLRLALLPRPSFPVLRFHPFFSTPFHPDARAQVQINHSGVFARSGLSAFPRSIRNRAADSISSSVNCVMFCSLFCLSRHIPAVRRGRKKGREVEVRTLLFSGLRSGGNTVSRIYFPPIGACLFSDAQFFNSG